MKTEISLPELLAIIEIVDEHVDRNFPGIEPPRLLRELQIKLDHVASDHRKEIATAIKTSRSSQSAKKSTKNKSAKTGAKSKPSKTPEKAGSRQSAKRH